MNFHRFFSAVAVLFLIVSFFLSCSNDYSKREDIVDLGNTFLWAPSSAGETCDEAMKRIDEFSKFKIHNGRNIARVAESKESYIWLMSGITLPETLKGKPLGLAVPHLNFAAEIYINGNYAGTVGQMPPNQKSQMCAASFFLFQENVLNQDGQNVILIKVWSQGRSSISEHVYLSDMERAKRIATAYSTLNSKIYMIFEGAMFSALLLFLMIFIRRRQDKEYLYFALINLASMILIQPFLAWEMPWFMTENLSFFVYSKIFCCLPACVICYFVTSFIYSYDNFDEPKPLFYTRLALLVLTCGSCILAPNYEFLVTVCFVVFAVLFVQVMFGFAFSFIQIFKGKNRRQNIAVLCGFAPFVLGVTLDIVLKDVFWLFDQPYYLVFGWQGSIIIFLIALTNKFTSFAVKNEYLSNDLAREVQIQTSHLSVAMEKLENEKKRSDMDMEMAAIVQQKFFPYPNKRFQGWDIATSYSPVSKVSGDLYDYYSETTDDDDGTDLKGFSLFDVSGHGISSGLITMLSKNIIFNAFRKSLEKKTPVSQVLYQINDNIIDAKGDIENYLTGLMFRISDFNENDECKIEFANAGHPSPVLFSAKSKIVASLDQDPSQLHYGAIGIKDIAISFPDMEFTMGNDDIIVCYTDGLTEAMNSNREEFGCERIMQIVRENYARNAQSILEAIIDGLYDFLGGCAREDDMTIMVLKRESSRNYVEEL